jgi:ribose 5-phosphate isomerase B
MKLLISSDHGGFALKEQIEKHYDIETADPDAAKVEVIDLGPDELNPEDDYPQYAFALGEQLLTMQGQGNVESGDVLGLLICRSGNGMAIAANKVKGIRAALCFTPKHAEMARNDDHANVLVLDSDYSDFEQQVAIIHAFISTKPEVGGRHERRVAEITTYEQR